MDGGRILAEQIVNFFGNFKEIGIMIISMIPIIELRGAIPIAIFGYDMNWILAFVLCVIANIIPILFAIAFTRPIFNFLKNLPFLEKIIHKLEKRTEKKADKIKEYVKWGLFLFVAVPLPGTGAWTGSMVAAFLDMRIKDAFWPIAGGVVTAGVIITILSKFFHFFTV